MKRIWVSFVAAGLLAIALAAPAAGQTIFSVMLDDLDDSGISGGGSLSESDGQVEVELYLTAGADEGSEFPVNIHQGTCEEIGDVEYELENLVDGGSTTEIDAQLSDLMTGEYVIAVGESPDNAETYVSCGMIPEVEGIGDGDEDAENGEGEDAEGTDGDDATSDDEGDDTDATNGEDSTTDDEDSTESEDGDDTSADDSDDAEAEEGASEDDDAAELAPAAGTTGGGGDQAAILFMTVLAGGALGAGLLVRRRTAHV